MFGGGGYFFTTYLIYFIYCKTPEIFSEKDLISDILVCAGVLKYISDVHASFQDFMYGHRVIYVLEQTYVYYRGNHCMLR